MNASEGQNADPLLARLHNWLETSGRALELRVARRFREVRAEVRPSFTYVDGVTGTHREIDVVADFIWPEKLVGTPDLSCSLAAVVECKSSRKHPWVAFHEGSQIASLEEPDDWLAYSLAPYTPVLDRLPNLWIGEDPFTNRRPATHVVAARFSDKEAGSGNESNPANDAVRQVLSAVESLKTSYIARQHDQRTGLFVLPVVVTSAKLYDCRLTRSGDVELRETARIDVWAYRPSDGKRTRVYILNEDQLPEFTTALRFRAVEAAG